MPTSLAISAIGLTYALSAGVAFTLAVYVVFRGDNDRTLQVFGILLVGIVVWSLALTGRLLTPNIGGKLIWQFVAYLGILAVPPSFLLFTIVYTGHSQYLSLPSIALLGVEPGFTFVLLVTNEAHNLYYRSVGLSVLGKTPILQTTAGPGFWLHAFVAYMFVGLGILFLIRFALTTERLYRVQIVAIITGALIPLFANVMFVIGLSPTPTFDLTPAAFTLSSLLLFVGIVYGRFVRIRPVDRDTVLSAVEDAIFVVDDNNQVIYANPSAKSVLSSEYQGSSQFIGESLSTILPIASTNSSDPTSAGGGKGFESSILRDEERQWFWIRRVTLGADEPGSNVVVLSDISKRKKRQLRSEQLQHATQRLLDVEDEQEVADIAVETADEVFELPISGVFLHKEEAERLEQVAATDAFGDTFRSVVHSDCSGKDDITHLIRQAYEREEPVVISRVSESEATDLMPTPIGSSIIQPIPQYGVFILSSQVPEAFDETDIALIEILSSMIKGAIDQAESRRTLRENKKRLKLQNERLEEFTSVVSHDLRSPLNTLKGYLKLLDEKYEDQQIGRAQEATVRMETLISDLLTLARQGSTVDEPTNINLSKTVERAWDSVSAPDGSLTVVHGLGHIPADESRLRQAFENLFRNAVEHGGEDVRIRVGTLSHTQGFYVEDDGPGIPSNQRERVFQHGYTTSDGGTGLGLAIVKRIFEAHGWTVRVTEGIDKGARFEVTGPDIHSENIPPTKSKD